MQADLNSLITALELPDTNLNSLSFCKSSRVAALTSWVESLPVTQMNRTGTILYKAVPEIPRLNTSAGNRLEILEALRPCVQQTIQGLTKHFLEQPLLHSEAAMKTAIVAQALQRHLSVGYYQVVREITRARPGGNFKGAEKKTLATAVHRALSGLGLQFLRSSQIYTQPTARLWLEINTLYRIAESFELLKFPCLDPLLKTRSANSIEQAYFRITLLACARPNQLTPKEVRIVYDLTESWSTLVQLAPLSDATRDLYGIDLGANSEPRYASELPEPRTPECRQLVLSHLLDTIAKQLDSDAEGQAIIELPASLPAHLLQHLLTTWGTKLERLNPRNQRQAELEVAIGLTNIHFHLAQQKSFSEFIRGAENSRYNFSLSDENGAGDPWDNAFDSEGLGRSHVELNLSLDMDAKAKDDANDQPGAAQSTIYPVQMLDFSSDGYRLDWRGEAPSQLKAGEIISVREPGSRDYRLGVIRWAKQHKHGTQLGILVLAHKIKAAAAQQLQKVGEDNVYMRAMLATESRHSDEYTRLITAAHPFRARNKVRIRDGNQTRSALLSELQFSSASVCIFDYRLQQTASDAVAPPGEDGAPRSNW